MVQATDRARLCVQGPAGKTQREVSVPLIQVAGLVVGSTFVTFGFIMTRECE